MRRASRLGVQEGKGRVRVCVRAACGVWACERGRRGGGRVKW